MLKAAWSDFWGITGSKNVHYKLNKLSPLYASRIGLIFKDRNIIGK